MSSNKKIMEKVVIVADHQRVFVRSDQFGHRHKLPRFPEDLSLSMILKQLLTETTMRTWNSTISDSLKDDTFAEKYCVCSETIMVSKLHTNHPIQVDLVWLGNTPILQNGQMWSFKDRFAPGKLNNPNGFSDIDRMLLAFAASYIKTDLTKTHPVVRAANIPAIVDETGMERFESCVEDIAVVVEKVTYVSGIYTVDGHQFLSCRPITVAFPATTDSNLVQDDVVKLHRFDDTWKIVSILSVDGCFITNPKE